MSTAVRNEEGRLIGEVIVKRNGIILDTESGDRLGTIEKVTTDWWSSESAHGGQLSRTTRNAVLEYLWTQHQDHLAAERERHARTLASADSVSVMDTTTGQVIHLGPDTQVAEADDQLPDPEDRVIPRGPETEAEEMAETIRKTGQPIPAPDGLDYSVGSQLVSLSELAYLPHGTLLVAMRGMHEGTSYRVHGTDLGPQVTHTRQSGISRARDLAKVVAADVNVEHWNMTIMWVPSTI